MNRSANRGVNRARALFGQILHARFDFPSPWWDNISEDAKKLVNGLLTIDPKKRLTADQVLENAWINGKAPREELPETIKSLKKYNASRKLKKAALGVMANNRLTKALEGLKVER